MSLKKTPNQSSGPKFIKDVTNKSRSEHNQSFDATYSKNYAPTFSNQSRLKSYSQQANFLDDLEEEQYPNQINVAIQKRPFELALQNELQKMLSKIIQGQYLSIDDCQSIIRAIDECIQESLQTLRLKDAEVQNIKQTYELKIHQYENTILALENEVQELKHMITLNPNDSINFKLQQLEQENEMLKLQNQQAIKLAVQGRTKKQEKELYDAMNSTIKQFIFLHFLLLLHFYLYQATVANLNKKLKSIIIQSCLTSNIIKFINKIRRLNHSYFDSYYFSYIQLILVRVNQFEQKFFDFCDLEF